MTHYEQYLKKTPNIQMAEDLIYELLSEFDNNNSAEVLKNDKVKLHWVLSKYRYHLVRKYIHMLRIYGMEKYKFVLIYFMYFNDCGGFEDIKEDGCMHSFLIELGSTYCDIQWDDIDFNNLNSCDGQYYYEKKLEIDDAMKRNLEAIITHPHPYIPQKDFDLIFEETEGEGEL